MQYLKVNETDLNAQTKGKAALCLLSQKVYKRAIIRIKFPNNYILQGEFGCKEKIKDIYDFVQEVTFTQEHFFGQWRI